MSFWDQCWHPEYTEPDADGKAICVKCGSVHQVLCTKELMVETFDLMYRQAVGHRRNCVNTEDGWCCAADCPSSRV